MKPKVVEVNLMTLLSNQQLAWSPVE